MSMEKKYRIVDNGTICVYRIGDPFQMTIYSRAYTDEDSRTSAIHDCYEFVRLCRALEAKQKSPELIAEL